MYDGKRFLAIIPARGGSKGLPGKNIITLGGKPLIVHTIEAAKGSRYLDRCIVSTDSERIRTIAEQWGGSSPFLRPPELAQDTTESVEVVIHALDWLSQRNEEFDYVVLLQPTSPLRNSEHIDRAIASIVDCKATSLASLTEVSEHPIHMRRIENGKLIKVVEYEGRSRRQEYPLFYKVNGAVYINTVDMLRSKKVFLDDNTIPFIMEKIFSVDIDTEHDLKLAEENLQKIRSRKE